MNLDEIKKEYEKLGFVLIKNFFEEKKIIGLNKIIKEFDVLNSNCKIYYEKNSDKVIRRLEDFSNEMSFLRDILSDNQLKKILSNLLEGKPIVFKEKLNLKQAKDGGGFEPHIDGHFYWKDFNGKIKKGWKEYANDFVNLVIPLVKCEKSNGCLKIFNKDVTTSTLGNTWECITEKLKDNGPFLNEQTILNRNAEYIEMNPGDILLFNWLCIHGSDCNNSLNDRPIMYITYNNHNNGDQKQKYYDDKKLSQSSDLQKSLS